MRKRIDFVLIAILLFALFLRTIGLNWDANAHLHPDERFLTMVGNQMKLPNIKDYFNPIISTFNPRNIGFPFFVYGTLPLFLNKILSVVLNNDNYNNFTLQGRFISALFDTLTILYIFKIALLFEKKFNFSLSIKYFASFFYAVAVLPIQLSHFFTVDTFLNFFSFASFFHAILFYEENRKTDIVYSALFFSAAFASKISAVFVLPLILFFILTAFRNPLKSFSNFTFFLLVFYFSSRIINPYFYESSNFLNPSINRHFIENIQTLRSYSNPDVWFPPIVQWTHKIPIIFSLFNLAIFGLGIPYFILTIFGIYRIIKINKFLLNLIILWTVVFFLYQTSQLTQTMRYLIFLYPFLALFAGIGFHHATKKLSISISVCIILVVLVWPTFSLSIYISQNSRVKASEWIYENLPNKSNLLGEHWDDPLPLSISSSHSKQFKINLLPVFDPDTQEKWNKINHLLNSSDYLILSSNRGWGSIPTVPEKYPLISKFYKDLFDGKVRYKKIKEFTSYPSLKYLGIPIEFPDDFAEEAFTVYDHPKVIIFKKS